jgi:hypothetical protein
MVSQKANKNYSISCLSMTSNINKKIDDSKDKITCFRNADQFGWDNKLFNNLEIGSDVS